MRQSVVALDPDLTTPSDSPLIYARHEAFATAATLDGLEYIVFGRREARAPENFAARIIPTFTDGSALSYNPGRLPDFWRQSRHVCDQVLWSLDRLRSPDSPPWTPNALLLYSGHPGHIAALVRLGLALGGAVPITLNLYHLHFMSGPNVPFSAKVWLRTFLRATRGLRQRANLRVRVDSPRLAELLEKDTGETVPVLPFFSCLDGLDALDSRLPTSDSRLPTPRSRIRLVYPTAMPSGDKGFDMVVGLAERLQRPDVEIVAREPVRHTESICLPTAAALRAGLRLQPQRIPGSSYAELLRSSDIVLVPYRQSRFRSRPSGVVADAIRLGKPMVGTADTWIGDRIEALRMGTTFADGDLDGFVDAVRRALVQLESSDTINAEGRESWLRENSLRALLRAVLDGERSPCSGPVRSLRLLWLAAFTQILLPLRFSGGRLLSFLMRRARAFVGRPRGSLQFIRSKTAKRDREAEVGQLNAIRWTTRRVHSIELRLDTPDGYLIGRGGAAGEVVGTIWIDDRRWIFLQDVSGGRPLDPQHSLDCRRFDVRRRPKSTLSASDRIAVAMLPLTRRLRTLGGRESPRLSVTPGPTRSKDGVTTAVIAWTCDAHAEVEVRIGRSDGELFARMMGPGSAETGPWVVDGTEFVLRDVRAGSPSFLRLLDTYRFTDAPSRYPMTPFGRASEVASQRPQKAEAQIDHAPPSPPAPTRRSLATVVGPTEWGVLTPASTGEVFLLAGYSNTFLKVYGGTRLVIFGLSNHVGLMNLFVDAPVTMLDRSQFDVEEFRKHGVQHGRVFELSYRPYVPTDGALGRFPYLRTGFVPLYFSEIRMSLQSPRIEPRVSPAFRDAVWSRFRDLELVEGRTVILAPNGYAPQSADAPTWLRIADVLRQRGFKVVSNCGPRELPIHGTVPFRGDIAELYVMVELSGVIVSARSGLCDICYGAKAKLHILQSDSILVPFPGVTVLPRLKDNSMPDSAVYSDRRLGEDPTRFADQVLAHPDLI